MGNNKKSAQTTPHADDATEPAPDVKDDPLDRLLFSEILLHEYEGMDQPALNQEQVDKIKGKIERYHKDLHLYQNGRKEGQPDFDEGEVLRDLYRLINEAQRHRAKELRSSFDDRNKDSYDLEKEKSDTAFVANVLGNDGPPKQQGNGNGKANYETSISPDDAEKLAGSTLRSALCLSGGGIRSATFNLGVLQGLARYGLLEKFDYLSTVSGGGFIGGWLSAWIRRKGLSEVCNELKNPPKSPLKPDPYPVEHLRIYSNYLSPQPGLLSADTWTLVASVIRNLLLNWLVFVPVLLAFLLVPRLWTALVIRSEQSSERSMWISLVIAFLSGLWALSYIARNLPSSNNYFTHPKAARYKGGQEPFIGLCLIWLVFSSAALSVFIWNRYRAGTEELSKYYYFFFLAAISAVSWFICGYKIGKITPKQKKGARYVWMVILATLLIVVVVPAITAYLANSLVLLTLPIFREYPLDYAVFSVPLILMLMSLNGLLIAGFASRLSKDEDQEWWARAGAWILIVALVWTVVHVLVLFGPLIILSLEDTYRNLKGGLSGLKWADWGKLFATIAGVVSGVVTIFGGFSAKTPANSSEAEKASTGGVLLGLVTQLLAPVFLGFLITLLSLGTNWLILTRPSQWIFKTFVAGAGAVLPAVSSPLTEWHFELLKGTPTRLILILFVILILIGGIMGRLISTNVFSLQYLWRNRIIRAYLGASHVNRRPDPFTGFDTYDNLQMHELWPQPGSGGNWSKREDRPENDLPYDIQPSKKLFHILNIALNLTGGEKLQWQDRKAESFTVSPFHAGSYWLGYRRSTHYGGTDGVTLGASVAISGAFVSPNMGFMMTSPVVRFLMAVFNVRFGWWLGNPGPAGEGTPWYERFLDSLLGQKETRPFERDSPGLSVIPFLSEAIGNTDDKSSYVYLSDGGHFENLGLYEMVLRRCRFIVVCDATTDPDYSFESLAMSIRQIRVDLGVPIEIPELAVGVPSQNLKSKYCAIGKIRYSCVDKPQKGQAVSGQTQDENLSDADYDGVLIFIKPSLIGEEPRDVINYWQGRSSFPQEVITDQWFSEAQFESYRALGSRIIQAICETDDFTSNDMTLGGFAHKVHEHNQLLFQAFNEHISLMALEHEFKTGMQTDTPDAYRVKVKKFIDKVLR